ncbi:hypothetical protein FEM48_Zijuj01G0052500 [Ziziphus jujuba var. spinosa]|uniref:Uncharacterized protein n=1 Tax=Ziziphus jujuba var. spinosa TaxID=714518 RepID=A0A978VZB9_ZIZJJ|nr:hypothetical protein FEM48_Zijuj01G0052500 [Ziziphus jujuba var. spinosa]
MVAMVFDQALVLQQKGDLMKFVDPKLESDFNKEEIVRVIIVALLCTNSSLALRPIMSAVLSMLEGYTVVPELIMDPSNYDVEDNWIQTSFASVLGFIKCYIEARQITTFLAIYIFTDTQNDEDYCTAGSKAEQKKAEKIAFDVNLEKFDTAAKIKQGITKEEANDMTEKRKAAGGVAIME